jgi:hypothetical protein
MKLIDKESATGGLQEHANTFDRDEDDNEDDNVDNINDFEEKDGNHLTSQHHLNFEIGS